MLGVDKKFKKLNFNKCTIKRKMWMITIKKYIILYNIAQNFSIRIIIQLAGGLKSLSRGISYACITLTNSITNSKHDFIGDNDVLLLD